MTKNSKFQNFTQRTIELETWPEVITGSTRMKAGSATKMVLNIISTILMIKLWMVYKNFMVDMKVTNDKLIRRAINMIKKIASCDNELEIITIFKETKLDVKLTIIRIIKQIDNTQARKMLKEKNGILVEVIG